MYMLKEIAISLIENTKERLKNPFIGSLAVSFFIYNWRIILILLQSSTEIELRIKYIEQNYLAADTLYFPFLTSLVYLTTIPYLNSLIDWFTNKAINNRTDRSFGRRISKLKHRISEARLERQIAEEIAGTNEIESLNNKIQELNETIDSKNKTIEEAITDQKLSKDKYFEMVKEMELLLSRKTAETDHILEENDKLTTALYFIDKKNLENDSSVKQFIKENISEKEKLILMDIENSSKPIMKLPFSPWLNILLERLNYIRPMDVNSNYIITDRGRKFLLEL